MKFKESWLVFICLLSLTILAFYDVVFCNKTFKVTTIVAQAMHNGVYGQALNRPKFLPLIGTDSAILEEPTLEFVKKSLHQGILPLWNPHQAGGFPLIAAIEVGIFFPLNWLVYLLPNIWSWDILILARILFGGFLTFLFLRRLGLKVIPSLAGALIFALSGPMTLLQYWTVNVDLLLPLLLLCIDNLVRRKTMSSIIMTALVVFLTFLAGHPEHIFLVNVYAFAFFVFRVLSVKGNPSLTLRMTVRLLCSYVLGLGLSAFILLPFLSNFHSQFWHGHPPGVGLLMEEQRERWISLLVPHFFQKVPVTLDWTFAGWWGGYIGTLPWVLAIVGLFQKQKCGLNYFFLILGVLLLSKAYGLFFINWIGHLPIFNICRYAIHTPHLVAFSVAVSAAFGVRLLFNLVGRRPYFVIKILLVSAGLMLLILSQFLILKKTFSDPFAGKAFWYALFWLAVVPVLFWTAGHFKNLRRYAGPVLIILIFIELFSYIHRGRVEKFNSFPEVPYINYLKQEENPLRAYGMFGAFSPNTGSGYLVDDLGIFNGLILDRYVQFVNRFLLPGNFVADLRPTALRDWPTTRASGPYLDLLNVKYTILPPEHAMQSIFPKFAKVKNQLVPPVYSAEVNIYPRSSAFERAFVASQVTYETDQDRIYQFLRDNGDQLDKKIVVKATPNVSTVRNYPLVKENSSVRIIRYAPNQVVIDADMADKGFVVLADVYHPGWKAFVDGREARVFETDGLLRSLEVPQGRHVVTFKFLPWSFSLGLLVSILTAIVCVGKLYSLRKI